MPLFRQSDDTHIWIDANQIVMIVQAREEGFCRVRMKHEELFPTILVKGEVHSLARDVQLERMSYVRK